jgi:hypothetical protein
MSESLFISIHFVIPEISGPPSFIEIAEEQEKVRRCLL